MKIGAGSTLECDCGAKFKLKKLTVVSRFNDEGELLSRSYCCKACDLQRNEFVVLLEDQLSFPLTLVEQANERDPRREAYP
jgi:hypothetical protein